MKELKLLIVEDDLSVIETYLSDISSYNKTSSDITIKETIIQDKDDALRILRNADHIFDGAIIDLDLKQSGGTDNSGNEVIKEVKENLRFPVFVISGTSHNLEKQLSEETSFFKVRDRDAEFDFIEEFIKIFNTGITEILNRRGTIENYINNIFWNHLSSSLDLWKKDEKRSPSDKQKSLLRYTLLHLQEYLDLSVSGDLEKYHPAEFFITKPVKPFIFTGDILKTKKGIRCVILTPACDIDKKNGVRKAEKILTLRIIEPKQVDSEFGNANMSTTKRNILKSIISNSRPRYHFIPKAGEIDKGIIDFQDKYSIPDSRLEKLIEDGEVERIATISSPFLKDVIARYSAYYSRQGSPDFDTDELFDGIF